MKFGKFFILDIIYTKTKLLKKIINYYELLKITSLDTAQLFCKVLIIRVNTENSYCAII